MKYKRAVVLPNRIAWQANFGAPPQRWFAELISAWVARSLGQIAKLGRASVAPAVPMSWAGPSIKAKRSA